MDNIENISASYNSLSLKTISKSLYRCRQDLECMDNIIKKGSIVLLKYNYNESLKSNNIVLDLYNPYNPNLKCSFHYIDCIEIYSLLEFDTLFEKDNFNTKYLSIIDNRHNKCKYILNILKNFISKSFICISLITILLICLVAFRVIYVDYLIPIMCILSGLFIIELILSFFIVFKLLSSNRKFIKKYKEHLNKRY